MATSFRDVLSIESPAQYCCQCQCDALNIRFGWLGSAGVEFPCTFRPSTVIHTHTQTRSIRQMFGRMAMRAQMTTYNEWHKLLNWSVCTVPRQNTAKSVRTNAAIQQFLFNSIPIAGASPSTWLPLPMQGLSLRIHQCQT